LAAPCLTVSKESYQDIVASSRFFFFTFANLQHKYTKKLYNTLQPCAMPVVPGSSKQNYERFIPEDHSSTSMTSPL